MCANFGLNLENHFAHLGEGFFTAMAAEKVGVSPRLLHANAAAAALIDLDPSVFADPDFAIAMAGHRPLKGFAPLAMVYSGHQFGVWAGQLGDGRALLVGQVRNTKGDLWDIQLKGSGKTPYSRFGDGRAVLRSSIREYLCSEAMAALGIPTSRALALLATGETVLRETPEPGALIVRLAPSHVRFGHFEHFHYAGQTDAVARLAAHVIGEHFPEYVGDLPGWFGAVVERTATLVAQWQATGFAHGVLNTDNMSILGITLDYGPFGFLDTYNPHFICNHTDEMGRYAFLNQPAVAQWNLRALAVALSRIISSDVLAASLQKYELQFSSAYRALMRAKCGFQREEEEDDNLIGELLALMAAARADYTLTFRDLPRAGEAWLARFGDHRVEAKAWLGRWRTRLMNEGDTAAAMDRVNPRYVLRNWVAETAIRAVQDHDDIAVLERIFALLRAPYDEHPDADCFAATPPPELRALEVSCSS